MSRAPSESLAPPAGKCRSCGEFLARVAGKRVRWECPNLFCRKNRRAEPLKIGSVAVYSKRGDS